MNNAVKVTHQDDSYSDAKRKMVKLEDDYSEWKQSVKLGLCKYDSNVSLDFRTKLADLVAQVSRESSTK